MPVWNEKTQRELGGLADALVLLNFHLGSQIADIQTLKLAF